ncbi:MAG: HAD hydrolase-like protein [Nanoarchaeota archaeon]|nr:HAD hydrolase-like protein [Nanoarchaeota archaeon]
MKIKRIGFDLDNTLYKQSIEMQEAIRATICKKVSKRINKPYNLVKEEFERIKIETSSTSKTLKSMGIDDPKAVLWEALQETDVSPFILKDEKLLNILNNLKKKSIILDLITARDKISSLNVLKSLGIPVEMFEIQIFAALKKEVTPYYNWVNISGLKTEELAYIGDSPVGDIYPIKKTEDLKNITAILVSNEKDEFADININKIYEIEKLF